MAGQNVHVGNGNSFFLGGPNSQLIFDDLYLPDLIGPDQLSSPGESSSSTDSHKRKTSGGRPKKILTIEELLECKDYTLEAAAQKLGASMTTVKRRITDLTGKPWFEFQQSIPDSQRLHGKERMQDEDKVVVGVDYNGGSYLFDLTKIKKPRRFQELEKLIKKSFNLLPKTYNVKYFRGGEDHTVFNSDTLQGCLSLADQFNPIKLKVEVTDAGKRI